VRRPSHTVIQISDTHLFSSEKKTLCGLNTSASFTSLYRALKREKNVDAFLTTGDISQDGTPASYLRFSRAMSTFKKPVYVLPGNHDHAPTLKKTLRRGFVRAIPSVQLGEWTLIFLDSTIPRRNEGRLKASDLNRLKRFLTRHRGGPVLISFHHHPIPLRSVWMDKMLIENAAAFQRVIRTSSHVRAVVFGHVHQAFEEKRNGVLYLGVPSASLQFKSKTEKMRLDARPPGYRWLQLFPNGKLKTGVRRLKNYSLRPDFHATGY
jgi:Icc protein